MFTTFANHNVCALPRHDKTIQATIAKAAKGASVVMWQELDNPVYRKALRAALPAWKHYFGGKANVNASPISYDPTVWKLIVGGSFLFQHGRQGWSKDRFWTWAVLESVANGRRVIVHAGHSVADAYGAHAAPDAAARRVEWVDGREVAAKHIAELAAKYGYPQVVGIDANRADASILHGTGINATARRAGVDWMLFVDGKDVRWAIGKLVTVPTPSDHDALRVPASPWVRPKAEAPAPAPVPVVVAAPAPAPAKFEAPQVPMIGAKYHGGSQTPRDIVMHSMVMACKPGAARACGHYFQTEQQPTSAHYGVDPDEVIQYVGDHTVAYHCGHNQDSIGIEMADMAGSNFLRWMSADQKAMLDRAADLVATLCLAYDIPAVFVDAAGLKAGKHGITTHAEETIAFRKSTHTDPGRWPRRKFMRLVKAKIAAKQAAAAKAA